MRVSLSTGEVGFIEGGFGQSGKAKIRVPAGLNEKTATQLETIAAAKKKRKPPAMKEVVGLPSEGDTRPTEGQAPIRVMLTFKRYVYDPQKKMIQS